MSPGEALLEIYDGIERELAAAGRACKACGRCCNFSANDYVLYASQIETDLVAEKTGRRPELAEGRCSFQDAAGRCTIRRWRPLGCRTYFCDQARPGGDSFEGLHERTLKRIKDLARQHHLEWRYGRFFAGG